MQAYDFKPIVTRHIYVEEWRTYASVHKAIIGSDYGLLPLPCQSIIWTSDELWLIKPLGPNVSKIWIKI